MIVASAADDATGGRKAPANAQEDTALLKASSARNKNEDTQADRDTPQDQLVLENHYGDRRDYLDNAKTDGNPESGFPFESGGEFRTACEFAFFGYNDPKVFPNQPGASHLHVFFGNTNVNAFTTYDQLKNSGGSTCNGGPLNRTSYWAPAMLDAQGNARVPERLVVYYKGETDFGKKSEVYPPGAFMLPKENVNLRSDYVAGKPTFLCTDQYVNPNSGIEGNTIPENCSGDMNLDPGARMILKQNIKFPTCWNRKDATNPDNFYFPTKSDWYSSICNDGDARLPNLEYFIHYPVDKGETTKGWHLASDVNNKTFTLDKPAGSTSHADWWGGWHPAINKMWVENCTDLRIVGTPTGCGFGYLTDGGPDNDNPLPGPALKLRQQYTGPDKVALKTLFSELCVTNRQFTKADDAAYCNPGTPGSMPPMPGMSDMPGMPGMSDAPSTSGSPAPTQSAAPTPGTSDAPSTSGSPAPTQSAAPTATMSAPMPSMSDMPPASPVVAATVSPTAQANNQFAELRRRLQQLERLLQDLVKQLGGFGQ